MEIKFASQASPDHQGGTNSVSFEMKKQRQLVQLIESGRFGEIIHDEATRDVLKTEEVKKAVYIAIRARLESFE